MAPTPQPESFGDPASATFAGTGNLAPVPATKPKPKALTRAQKLARALKQCHKKPKRKRPACERKARKLYGAKKASAPKGHSTNIGRR